MAGPDLRCAVAAGGLAGGTDPPCRYFNGTGGIRRTDGGGHNGRMVRTPLTPEERDRGERLGRLLRAARGDRSMVEVAAAAGVSAETLRKIETGRAPTPAFFTVAAVAAVLGLSMDDLAAHCTLAAV
ncbi:hypothetical protein STEPF1_03139 [Streptomyces sp. F-1]|nr:hypothetical protein STEPF1_03139 [Streptomyces sp. F-1]